MKNNKSNTSVKHEAQTSSAPQEGRDNTPSAGWIEKLIDDIAAVERKRNMENLRGRRSAYDYVMQNVDDDPSREFAEGLMVIYGRLEGQIKARSAGKSVSAYPRCLQT